MKKRCFRSLPALLLALALIISMIPASALASKIMYIRTGNSGRLNLRALPSTQSESLGLYANGTAVTVDYTSGEWAYVSVGGQRGFMILSCLTETKPADGGTTPDSPSHTENTTMYISTGNSGGLHLRVNASRSARSLGIFPNGTKVTVMNRDGAGWAYVSVNGTTGFMMLQYLTPYNPDPVVPVGPTLDPAAATTMYIATGNSGRLNLRELPSQQSRSLGLFANDTEVQAILLASGWAQVIVNGQRGFMMSKFLTATAPGTSSGGGIKPDGTAPTAAPGYVGIMYVATGNSGRLNLRENVSTSSASLGLYPNGTPVSVHATIGAWAHVTVEGKTGYMMNQFLSVSAPSVPSSGGTPSTLPGTATVRQPSGSFVYLRSSASSANLLNVVDKVPSGTLVEVLSWGEYWSYISYNGKQGYMVTQYLK